MSSPEWTTNVSEPYSHQEETGVNDESEATATPAALVEEKTHAQVADVASRRVVQGGREDTHTQADTYNVGQKLSQRTEDDVGKMRQGSATLLEDRTQMLSVSPNPADSSVDNTGEDALREPHAQRDEDYLDPTPTTPRQSASPSRTPADPGDVQHDEGSTSEIQSIMDQFGDDDDSHQADEDSSTRLGLAVEHPPRKSSLEPLSSQSPAQSVGNIGVASYQQGNANPTQEAPTYEAPPKRAPMRTSSLPQSTRFQTRDTNTPSSPNSSMSLPKLPPPEPDPEPDLPFDFHRFLEQLRHRTADPVAKFLRSFLIEFGKKQWMVHEQVKIVNDFLTFITNKMAQCEVWRGVSDAEFDNAKEGMEKLVMNRLYSQTFSPAIPSPAPLQGPKAKRKNVEKPLGPGRRGQHQEDIERDEILGQKVRIYGWVQEEHLDILPVGDSGRRFLVLAQQELLKIKTYRAPRDKVICVLNCCKVIFGLLRNSKAADTSADSFVPLLIYVVLHANPDHLVSNIQYILRFRNQDKLGGEAGYYLSSLMGAIQFIENLDRTSLTVSDDEFEKNVEAAVSAIAERHKEEMPPTLPPRHPIHPQISEKSGLSQPEVVPRNSIEAEYSTPRKSTSSRENSGPSIGSDGLDDSTAVGGLLRTIQRPLSSLGRMFSEEPLPSQRSGSRTHSRPVTQQNPPQRLSPEVFRPPRNSNETRRSNEAAQSVDRANQSQERKLSAEDAAARQASAEAAEAQRIQSDEHQDVVETLAGMFPDLDKDIIDDVVRVKQGRVGLAVDACLALNS